MTQAIKEYQGLRVQQDGVDVDTTVDTIEFDSDHFTVTEATKRELDVTQRNVIPIFNDIKIVITDLTSYFAIGSNGNTNVAPGSYNFNVHPPRTHFQACTIQNLIVEGLANSGTGTLTLTVMKNGIDTALLKQIAISTTWNKDRNITDTVSLADGDYLTIKIVRADALLSAIRFYLEAVQ